ncbi:ATP-binding cassette domain-containing protein [Companilactobacillus bobalius]|uniref:Thiamine import ATP-binding protein ThiQ n=2 Tax=Companilactobacillus bobalius TaxID=2801451 RepID=A0A202FFD7_9LACO|nr:ABC transporter ATP-binding protein [Companilactobacillus bobalius]KAE9560358.1 hypothetical protein ATN92_09325 [Companilactobacillus bobalius]KRK83102.1 abc transporter atp binding and permease protein [Companilactobacillus bobalius DSM 19674]OVE99209.1 Thiamine import ATP-binding protein ThiQ [Companilactobacillus bobalius]GEO57186.1 ABC transporter ATP-binding protein [Companilactobacillus paralimentarius]
MIKTMMDNHRKMTVLVIFLAIISSAIQTSSNLILIYAINAIVAHKLNLFIKKLVIMILLYLLFWMTGYYKNVLEEILIQRENHRIRNKYIDNQIIKSFSDKISTDKSINLLTSDILLYDQQYLQGFFKLFNCIFGILFASTALIILHWSLFLLSIIMIICLIMSPKLVGHRLQKTTKKISECNNDLLKTLNDWFAGSQDLLWNNAIIQLWKHSRPAFDDLENSYVDQKRAQQTAIQFGAFINILSQASIISLAGILAIHGVVSLGVVMSAGNLAFQLFGAVSIATNSIILLQSGTGLRDKLKRAISPYSYDSNSTKITFNDVKTITAHDLSYTFKNGKTIKYPDFHVEYGDKVLITGPSGSGKTTLINLLSGHLKNYNGSLTLNNYRYSSLSNHSLLNVIGIQPQYYHIFNDSIVNNITLYDNKFSHADVLKSLRSAQLFDKISSLPDGLDTKIGKTSNVLSGGEMQRISLARFFIRKKVMLIVDEGTSALDKSRAEDVMRLLTNRPNLTLFVITHSTDKKILNMFNKHIELN